MSSSRLSIGLLLIATGACEGPTSSPGESGPIGSPDLPAPRSDLAAMCTGVIGAVTVDKVEVPSGAECVLVHTQVKGNVKVLPGGRIDMFSAHIGGNVQVEPGGAVYSGGAQIRGNLQSDGARFVRLDCDASLLADCPTSRTMVWGNVQIKKTTGDPVFTSYVCNQTWIRQNLQLEENTDSFMVGDAECFFGGNSVGGNLKAKKNATIFISRNQIGGNLQCKDNVVISGHSNVVAGNKEGQCGAF